MEAAVTIQRRVAAEPWPERRPVRVRIGVHSGEPTLTEAGYVGLPVHTCARICMAGHGGQILVSRDAREQIGRSGPLDVTYRSLGTFQLHGLPEPIELFQVHGQDLEADFPPLRPPAVATTAPAV